MSTNSFGNPRLLVVSRESGTLRQFCSLAESNSWNLETASDGWDAREQVQSERTPGLVVLDVAEDDVDSSRLLLWLRRLYPDLPVLVLCHPLAEGRQQEVIGLGARQVLVRPFHSGELESIVQAHLQSPESYPHSNHGAQLRMVDTKFQDIDSLGEDEFFLSVSPMMQKLSAQAELLALADIPVLILGEPGSGKGSFARLIHKLSVYSGFQFLRINCAQLPEKLLEIRLFGNGNAGSSGLIASPNGATAGKFDIREKGTLLLDEITEMSLDLQARLLEVVQDKQSVRSENGKGRGGVRILTASSANIDRAISEKRFREDLYSRLSTFSVHVPPLRAHKDDIKVLLRYTMHKLAKYYGLPAREFTPSTLATCQNYDWPGNLKELQSFVKRYLVAGDYESPMAGLSSASSGNGHANSNKGQGSSGRSVAFPVADEEEFGEHIIDSSPKSLRSLLESVKGEAEKKAIAAALEQTGWNRKAAARLLGVSYRTMLYKIEQYQMSARTSHLSSFPVTQLAGLGQFKKGKVS
jgi:DNA-binding NtrC family response regulator